MNIEVRKSDVTDILQQALGATGVVCNRLELPDDDGNLVKYDAWVWQGIVGEHSFGITLNGDLLSEDDETFNRYLAYEIVGVADALADTKPIRRGDTLRDNDGNIVTFEGGI